MIDLGYCTVELTYELAKRIIKLDNTLPFGCLTKENINRAKEFLNEKEKEKNFYSLFERYVVIIYKNEEFYKACRNYILDMYSSLVDRSNKTHIYMKDGSVFSFVTDDIYATRGYRYDLAIVEGGGWMGASDWEWLKSRAKPDGGKIKVVDLEELMYV